MEEYNGIIIFGEMGSGKDTLADMIIEEHPGIKKYGLGDLIRSMKPILRVSPQWKGKERGFYQSIADKLREIDNNILNKYCLSKMFSEYSKGELREVTLENELEDISFNLNLVNKEFIPMIVGGRTYDDYDYWKSIGFMIVGIKTDKDLRMNRLILRDGEEVAKKSDPNHNTEKNVVDIVKKADCVLENNGTLEDLRKKVKKINFSKV